MHQHKLLLAFCVRNTIVAVEVDTVPEASMGIQVTTTLRAKRCRTNFHFVVCVADDSGATRDIPGVDRHEANAVAAARMVQASGLHVRVWVEKRAGRS